jgi:hypothetical protein
MAGDLQLRKRALELELELAQAQQAHGQMTHQGAPMDPEALTKLRGAASAALTGPSSAVAGLADLATQGLTNRAQDAINYGRRVVNVGSRLVGGNAAQGDVQLSEPYKFSPPVQQLEDTLAGSSRQPGEYLRPAMSAATGSLLFPGGPVTNLASGGAASVADTGLASSGAGPKSRLAGSVLAAYLAAKGVQGAGRFAANRLDTPLGGTGRIAYAVEQSDPVALVEAAKEQKRMASRGYQIFPGQGTQYETPALDRLQAEVVQSHGGGKAAQALRQRATQQQHEAARIVKETVDQLPGVAAPPGRAASDLVYAAQKRLGAEGEASNAVTALDYESGKAAIRAVPEGILSKIREELKAAHQAAPAASSEASQLATLQRRYEQVIRASDGRPRPIDLWQLHKDFVASLDDPNSFTANTLKGDLRKTSERVLMRAAEEASPQLEKARVTASILKDRNPVRLDPLTKLGGAGDADAALQQVLQSPDPLAQIASGVPAWKNDLGQMRRVGTEVLGADLPAAQTGLKTAFEQARQKAYALGTGGKVSPQAALLFRNQVAGLPNQQGALANTLKALGADAPGIMTNLDDITSLSRPSLPTHAYPAGTDINAFQMTKAVAGGPFAREASQTNLIRSLVNRMSNRSVAKVLNLPNSVEEMQRIAGAQAMEPRKLLSLILAGQVQAQQNQAQPIPQE